MRKLFLLVVLVVMAVLVRMSFFTVDATEFAYVTQLGEHVATYDGADLEHGAGLHWRWPWPVQSVQRLDRRLQYFDLPVIELLTRDAERQRIGKTLVAETYACWRIPDDQGVDQFIRSIGTPEQARTILGQRINSRLGAFTGRMRLEDLISTEPGQADRKLEELRKDVLESLQGEVRTAYGIELVDVRLRRFNHPPSVRDSIFERITSERKKMVEDIKSHGETEASNIRSKAEAEAKGLLARARAEEETLKGQADTEAALIRNQAHSQDPDFYVFLQKMKRLDSILGDNKTVLLLSSHRAMFDLLFQPPQPGGARPPIPAGTNSTSAGPPAGARTEADAHTARRERPPAGRKEGGQ
jgi:membrane protease subunit HflC